MQMGNWRKVEPKAYSPCDGCEMGWGSISQKVKNGELYTKTDDCHETCQQYQDWLDGKLVHTIVQERHDALLELGMEDNREIYRQLAKC